MINRLTDTLNFQAQALQLRSTRQQLLASNIANADTPGYQAREMDFASTLRQATGSLGAGGVAVAAPSSGTAVSASAMSVTQAGHLFTPTTSLNDNSLAYALPSQTSLDNNTVDMDRERASFADNSVKYEAALRFINGDVKNALDAMKSANGS